MEHANIQGVWKMTLGLSSVKIVVRQERRVKIFGVVTVRSFWGNEDVYHFYGRVDGNFVAAKHHNGRHFSGKVLTPNLIEGTLTLQNGSKVNLSATRISR